MSLYRETQVDELRATLNSIVEQTVPTNELIVVLDGPVSAEIRLTLLEFSGLLPIRIQPLPVNCGLGSALAKGLSCCSYDWIFRIDSDDVYPANRFALQIEYAKRNPNTKVLGGYLNEIYNSGREISTRTRFVPLDSRAVGRYAKWRNPLNHQTVFFNKKTVLLVGGYQDMPFFEDYYLWARLLVAGYRIENLNHVLAQTSVHDEYFRRRGGSAYTRHELRFLKSLVECGFISRLHGAIVFAGRLIVRILPTRLRRGFYKLVLR